ncbi:MAG: 30S ribosomal protein S16 [bacterium]
MAVKLRLRRMGKKRQPIYKLVAADARSPRDGKFIEAIGNYNPRMEPPTIEINQERALYWIGVGAQPTATVKNLLSKKGILYLLDLQKRGLKVEEIAAKMEEWNTTHNIVVAAKPVKKEIQVIVEDDKEVKGAASETEQN